MAFTYINRKHQTYYISRRVTRSGAPRYVVSQKPGEHPLEALPEGYEIRENVNGHVSIGPIRPRNITVEEEQLVLRKLAAVKPLYRLEIKENAITINQPLTTVDGLLRAMGQGLPPEFVESRRSSMEAYVATYGQYTPVFLFELRNEDTRLFVARRMTYRGEGGWSHVLSDGPLETLADLYLPYLGTDAFFELY